MKKALVPQDTIIEVGYSLGGFARYSIRKLGEEWAVMHHLGGGSNFTIQLMDGRKAGGLFSTFEKAEEELARIFATMQAPLTRREIRHHFSKARMRREDQAAELLRFRDALERGQMKRAARIYKQFSSYTKEAIPEKVMLQMAASLRQTLDHSRQFATLHPR